MSKNEALIIGASRGLGLAIAHELLRRGWNVTATVRGEARTGLHAMADDFPGMLGIEHLEMTVPDQIAALKNTLAGRSFDLLFVNAGITHDKYRILGEFSTEEFVQVMVTNALAPVRVLEQLTGNVRDGGTVGVIGSRQYQEQQGRRGRSLPGEQGGAQHADEELCGASRRESRAVRDGAGLDPNGHGRPTGDLYRR